MQELIKDFTPFFVDGNYAIPQKDVRQDIGYLLSMLNTHRLINEGGVDLYKEKEAYLDIDVGSEDQDVIPGALAVSNFMGTRLTRMAEEAFGAAEPIRVVAEHLQKFNPDSVDSAKELERSWLENNELIENLIYLYSEYLYRVFLQNPFQESTSIN